MARSSLFRFKQFTVQQDRCAMKVCTDACVLGAWADISGAERILDIGTGTGLLSMMAAQRNAYATIDSVEVNKDAFEQAAENFKESPFQERIEVVHTAIQDFEPGKLYDCVITNPPFFQSDLRSPNAVKNVAHHAASLSFDDLLVVVNRLLKPEGAFHVLLPVDEGMVFEQKALAQNWFVHAKLTLYHAFGKKPFRLLLTFRRTEVVGNGEINQELYIYEQDGKLYHPKFKMLMKDFYLIF